MSSQHIWSSASFISLRAEIGLGNGSVSARSLSHLHAGRYAVIDRPLAEKQRDAGWRAGRGIVERYHEEFAQQVVVVLAGDGDPRVKVQDLRKVSAK